MIDEKRKGQYLIVEQMVIFTIGIFIALTFISIFGEFESDVRRETTTNQLQTYSKAMTNKIVSLIDTNTSSEVTIDIPKTLSEKSYLIELSDGLYIHSRGHDLKSNYSYRSNLLGYADKLQMSGKVLSKRGSAKLIYDGEDNLKIEGA